MTFAIRLVAILPILIANPMLAIEVNTIQDVVGADGLCSLREAITVANAGAPVGALPGDCQPGTPPQQISVPAGVYRLDTLGAREDDNLSGDLDVDADLAIHGAGIGSTIIDGNASDRVLDVQSGTVISLRDLGIRNGHAPDAGPGLLVEHGGGIRSFSASVTLVRVELRDNRAGDNAEGHAGTGGGVMNEYGQLDLIASRVFDNQSGSGAFGGEGGGIFLYSASLNLLRSSVVGNRAGAGEPAASVRGGGILSASSSVTITESRVSANGFLSGDFGQGTTLGGGLFLTGGALTIERSSLTDNEATVGGAIYAEGLAPISIRNSTLAGNHAAATGSALLRDNASAPTRLIFTTVTGNTADDGVALTVAGSIEIGNSIVSGNPGNDDCVDGAIVSLGYNLVGAGCPASGPGDIVTNDPELGGMSAGDGLTDYLMPRPASPAIDAGNCQADATSVDQRGRKRHVDIPRRPDTFDGCDIGAAELDDSLFWDGYEN